MQELISLRLLPSEAATDADLRKSIAKACGRKIQSVTGYVILRQSLDARGRQPWIQLSIRVFIDEPSRPRELMQFSFRNVRNAARRIAIIGTGPAGLFAALTLLEHGIKPILLERGKDVRNRRRDLAQLNKEGIINPESNYCFGEGGAGTYSDGKLYTRSSKRGDIQRILQLFVHFGAEENILYEAHPHIGTNKLPKIIEAIRKRILDCGGEIWFENKVVDFRISHSSISAIVTADKNLVETDAVILATGHSARDIFQLLQSKKIAIEMKPFALGVRVEHPQSLIDQIQYPASAILSNSRGKHSLIHHLPPASYNLVQQVREKGVFSFCMCPGGIIAPASTEAGELVTNGWSPSRRNNPFANSGMVVTVEEKDLQGFRQFGPLAGLRFQQSVEQKAFAAGGGNFKAPAQRMVDFVENRLSDSLPTCSYLPGLTSSDLRSVLPPFIHKALVEAFREFGKKMRKTAEGQSFLTNEALVVATESRTSSPVRIPRLPDKLSHPQILNLYPCGEGAGYAGGIVSAAMDGEKIANAIARSPSTK